MDTIRGGLTMATQTLVKKKKNTSGHKCVKSRIKINVFVHVCHMSLGR